MPNSAPPTAAPDRLPRVAIWRAWLASKAAAQRQRLRGHHGGGKGKQPHRELAAHQVARNSITAERRQKRERCAKKPKARPMSRPAGPGPRAHPGGRSGLHRRPWGSARRAAGRASGLDVGRALLLQLGQAHHARRRELGFLMNCSFFRLRFFSVISQISNFTPRATRADTGPAKGLPLTSFWPSSRKSTPSACVTTVILAAGSTSRWLRMLRRPLSACSDMSSMW
jgi:hypothetical protein